MTLHQAIILGRILLLLALASLCLYLALGATVSRRLRILSFVVLVGALIGYPNFGAFHPKHSGYRPGHIHYYDAFHYFMGAKYFPELGYSGLYEATLVAAHLRLGFRGRRSIPSRLVSPDAAPPEVSPSSPTTPA